jgi:PAS domain S-box-containing protein
MPDNTTITTTKRSFDRISSALVWMVLLLACASIAAWIARIDRLIHYSADVAPMQFNTALCFVLVASALLLSHRGWMRAGQGAAVAVLLIACTTLLQYVLHVDLGIDRLFHDPHLVNKTVVPGRMAPVTAFAFILSAIAAFLHTSAGARLWGDSWVVGLSGGSMLAALHSWVFQFYGIDQELQIFTHLAPQTLLLFALLSAALVLPRTHTFRLQDNARSERNRNWFISLFAVLIFASWQSIEHNEWKKNEVETQIALASVLAQTGNSIERYGSVVRRISEDWAILGVPTKTQWENRAGIVLRDYPGLHALIYTDETTTVRWRVSRDGQGQDLIGRRLSTDNFRDGVFADAATSLRVRMTPSIDLHSGGRGVSLVSPVLIDGELQGFITASIRADGIVKLFDDASLAGFSIMIRDRNGELMQRSARDQGFGFPILKESQLDALGQVWHVEVWPTLDHIKANRSSLPEVLLLFGILTLMLAVTAMRESARAARSRIEARQLASRLASTLDAISDAFFLLDTAWRFSYINPQAERVLGRAGNKLLGKIVWDEFPEAVGTVFEREYSRAVEEKRRVEFEAFYPPLDSWFSVRAYPVQEGLAVYFQDITEKRRNTEKLQQKDALLRLAGNLQRMGGWAIDLTDNRIEWSDQIYQILEWEGSNPPVLEVALDLYPPEWRPSITAALKSCIQDGKPFDLELQVNTAKGRRIWVRAIGEAERNASGNIVRVHGAFQDIDSRKRFEENLRVSEERFRLLSRATDDAIWDWDLQTNALWWSEGLEQLFGYGPGEVRPDITFWEEQIHPEDRADVLESVNHAIAKGDTKWIGHYRFLCKDGSYTQVRDRGHVIRDAGGHALRMIGGMADITERLQLEEQLRQSQRLESVGQLTGGLAHDFNNLLTVIMGNAELLEEGLAGDDRSRALAEMITGAAQRGAELTQRLLAFARKQPLNPKSVAINDLAAGMEPLLRRTLGEHIEIEFVRGAGLWQALIDPAQLESALLNLCLNSRDAMPDGGRLTIETGNVRLDQDYADQHADVRPGQYVMVAVTDSGTGIAPEHLGRIFEPFFTTKEKGKGTGLGLPMVYGFIKQSGGHISLYSEPGEGTTVKLYLPRITADQVAAEVRETVHPSGGTETILLVEDDDMVRRYAYDQLVTLGYRVIEAADGRQGLQIIRERADIDLLFTDVVMPGGMSGRQLADEAKKLRPGLKVLYTSGYTENAIVHHGRLDPGVLLLAKPYRRAELARFVREAISRTGKDIDE